MRPVRVRIMHPAPSPAAGPLERWVADARASLADRHVAGFRAAGASDVEIVTGPADGGSFGARLRALVPTPPGGGLVVVGSGAIPLATASDRRAFVIAAGSEDLRALANNRFSADVVAIARLDCLPPVPDLPGDNELPRWLDEVAGFAVGDLRRRWRLGFDVDGPLDLVLLGARGRRGVELTAVTERLAAARTVAADRRAELVVAGRTSAGTLAWLERHAAARVRAWIEERGLRASSRLAQAGRDRAATSVPTTPARGSRAGPRPAASLLGELVERDGPGSLGRLLARFGEAAFVDSRVLMAHRLGVDERAWPAAEDRFASDLLLPAAIADPWLRELTQAALAAPIPVVLGGHSLVGPGIRLAIGPARRTAPPWT